MTHNQTNKKLSVPVTAISVILIFLATPTTAAQTPACAEKLIPCMDYMKSTSPPDSCCTPLKEAVEKELPCLCNLFKTHGLLSSLGVNMNEALLLPSHCKINGDLSACSNVTSPVSSTKSPPGDLGNDGVRSSKSTWTGLCAILLLFVSTLIYTNNDIFSSFV